MIIGRANRRFDTADPACAPWVNALVDPPSRDGSAFQAEIVPANHTAVPAP
jgi:hypothetical protein